MKISNVVLVDPKQPSAPSATGFNEFIEPLGLCYIASYLKKYGYKVKIMQQGFKTDKEMINLIINSKPDIVGFTAVTCVYPRAKDFSTYLRKKGIPTILGGAHATADPNYCCKNFDYVVMGEGETTLLELLNALNTKRKIEKIKGLAFYSKLGESPRGLASWHH